MIDGPDDITADWLTTALRTSTPEAHVRAVTVEQIGTGQTGASFRLHLDADGPLPPTLVAKTAAGDRAQRERVGPGYRSEVGFYTVFRDRVQIRTPRCWHAEISDDNCSFVLLLDDLAPARPGVQADGCSVEQATDAVRNLAGLHAPLWNDTHAVRPRRLPVVDDGSADRVPGLDHAERGRGVLRALRGELGDDATTLRESAALTGTVGRGRHRCAHAGARRLPARQPDVPRRARRRRRPPSTGRRSPIAPPGRDLGYFLATSLHVDDRRAHQDTLVAAYVDEVRRLGVADCTVEQCDHEYRLGVLQAPMITMIGAAYATAGRSASADAMFLAMATRACAAIRDLDSFALVESS